MNHPGNPCGIQVSLTRLVAFLFFSRADKGNFPPPHNIPRHKTSLNDENMVSGVKLAPSHSHLQIDERTCFFPRTSSRELRPITFERAREIITRKILSRGEGFFCGETLHPRMPLCRPKVEGAIWWCNNTDVHSEELSGERLSRHAG